MIRRWGDEPVPNRKVQPPIELVTHGLSCGKENGEHAMPRTNKRELAALMVGRVLGVVVAVAGTSVVVALAVWAWRRALGF